jgi:hypothetical protein
MSYLSEEDTTNERLGKYKLLCDGYHKNEPYLVLGPDCKSHLI